MRIFVLGASDPEMREIANVLRAAGERYVYACIGDVRVHAANAYTADCVSSRLPKRVDLVFVECAVRGLRPSHIVDHHNPGDPGFECGPADYLKGSSLGQVLALLRREPTEEQRIICAADHCPQQAYQGLCPGVTPVALSDWRLASKAAFKGISVDELRALVEVQHERLKAADRVTIAGVEVAWLPESADETPEASARYGIPFMYRTVERDGRNKAGILSAPAHVVEAWMRDCGLSDVYGSPSRGYAGGYF
jgi:hypothetical protein